MANRHQGRHFVPVTYRQPARGALPEGRNTEGLRFFGKTEPFVQIVNETRYSHGHGETGQEETHDCHPKGATWWGAT
jgi:hypothetical protein